MIENLRATGLSVEDCYVLPSLNKVDFSYHVSQHLANKHLAKGQATVVRRVDNATLILL